MYGEGGQHVCNYYRTRSLENANNVNVCDKKQKLNKKVKKKKPKPNNNKIFAHFPDTRVFANEIFVRQYDRV